jgi:RND family efflux transporter MFP subunit
MRRAVPVLFVLAVGFLSGWAVNHWRSQNAAESSAEKGGRKILYWHDPMHPSYRSDKPGIAPDCGMPLEPVYADGGAPAAEKKILHYTDPQDPNYKSDKPGLNPETGNDLVPVYADDASSMPSGTVQISAEKQQLIGVQFGVVESMSGERTFRTVGRVAFDDTRISRVHPRVEGWVDDVFVDYTGANVRAGQPLLTVYSPELVASQQEYLLAIRGSEVLRESSLPDTDRQAHALIEASRRRLEQFELSEEQVRQIGQTGKPIRNVTLFAPVSGTVIARNVFPKQRITPEMELYQIVDMSRLWVIADVFETDAPFVRVGQSASITLPYANRSMTAKVVQVLPQVNAESRTLQVRLDVPNPGLALKPDMYVDVDFRVAGTSKLSVPAEAVLDTGQKQTVFVDRGNGYFEPRRVQGGERFGGRVEIVSGLRAGERVVTSGNFLIDSESQLKSPTTPAAGGAHQHSQSPSPPPASPVAPPNAGVHKHD